MKHISVITLYSSLFFLMFSLVVYLLFHTGGISITPRNLAVWLVFNQPIPGIAGQYWFLFALIYAYAFYGLLEGLHLRKFAYYLMAFMFVVYIVMAQGLHLAGFHIPNFVYRNWLVEAFPFFMLGHWIHEYQNRIEISNGVLIGIVVITTLLCLVERWAMGRDFGVNIVTIPQVFALFMYGVKNPTRHEGVIQRLGRDCSMMVYILHPAVLLSLGGVYSRFGLSDNLPALYMMPILVLGISIVLSLLFNNVVDKMKKTSVA
ncbi:MAG: acyltransferase family protein [Paludibacteraceae bacterium]|nr:acyltransferase family protein [Paludibacteraceae bacterium]